MHNNEFSRFFYGFAPFVIGFLSIAFWFSLIFSFDTPAIAFATLISILTHELGHFIVIFVLGKRVGGFRGSISGLRIRKGETSYTEEFLIYLGGPLANAVLILVSSLFVRLEYARIVLALNAATCMSNLLPAEGYDGYGMIRCLLMQNECSEPCYVILECISLLTSTFFCILSLYVMDRCGEGFWLFFVFFVATLKKMSNLNKGAKNEI